MAKILKSIKNGIEEVSWNVTQPIRGLVKDVERGHLLWKQGYGDYYDSAMSVAKKGKGGVKYPRRVPRGK